MSLRAKWTNRLNVNRIIFMFALIVFNEFGNFANFGEIFSKSCFSASLIRTMANGAPS